MHLFDPITASSVQLENAKVPYLKGCFEIEGIPEGISWKKSNGATKKPTDYGPGQIEKIMENKEKIKFVIKNSEQRNDLEDTLPDVPPCLLKLVELEVANNALNGNCKIQEEEINVLVQLREDESELLLRRFGHLFDDDAKMAIARNFSCRSGIILPTYTKRKGKFWLFYYEGKVADIIDARDAASIPGKWLDCIHLHKFKLLPQPTSIKRMNVILDKNGQLLYCPHFIKSGEDLIDVNRDFLKEIQNSI